MNRILRVPALCLLLLSACAALHGWVWVWFWVALHGGSERGSRWPCMVGLGVGIGVCMTYFEEESRSVCAGDAHLPLSPPLPLPPHSPSSDRSWLRGVPPARMKACLHECLCTYVCTHDFTFVCIYVCIYTSMFASMCVHIFACCAHVLHVCTFLCMYCVCMFACCAHVYMFCLYAHILAHMQACLHICKHVVHMCTCFACLYACLHLCTHVCTYHICTNASMLCIQVVEKECKHVVHPSDTGAGTPFSDQVVGRVAQQWLDPAMMFLF